MKNLTFVSALLLALASPVAPALAHGFGGGVFHGVADTTLTVVVTAAGLPYVAVPAAARGAWRQTH